MRKVCGQCGHSTSMAEFTAYRGRCEDCWTYSPYNNHPSAIPASGTTTGCEVFKTSKQFRMYKIRSNTRKLPFYKEQML